MKCLIAVLVIVATTACAHGADAPCHSVSMPSQNAAGAVPDVFDCGVAAGIDSQSDDNRGLVRVGDGIVKCCSVAFTAPYDRAPYCMAQILDEFVDAPLDVTETVTNFTVQRRDDKPLDRSRIAYMCFADDDTSPVGFDVGWHFGKAGLKTPAERRAYIQSELFKPQIGEVGLVGVCADAKRYRYRSPDDFPLVTTPCPCASGRGQCYVVVWEEVP